LSQMAALVLQYLAILLYVNCLSVNHTIVYC
jgi:hypothetical protein